MNNTQRLAVFMDYVYCESNYATMFPASYLDKNGDTVCDVEDWQPQTNRDQCAMLEERVREKGLTGEYMMELIRILPMPHMVYDRHFNIATATPQQRCEALLKVIGEKE